jgi:transposase
MKTQKIKLTAEQIDELKKYKEDKDCLLSESNRIHAILMVNRKAEPDFIKEITGYDQQYAFELRKKYIRKGLKSLLSKRKKPRALLTKGQKDQIVKIITTTTPRSFGFEDDHWTTPILGLLIKEQYGVQFKSKTSLYLFFKEAKFTYHKPDKQYKNRDQDRINEWVARNTPIIQQAIIDPDTVVLVEDEMMLSTQTTTQKIWLPRGEFPKIDVSSKRQNRCVYGFLNMRTGKEHAFKTVRANSEETCKVLDKIGHIYENKKIVLIWDNASWHKSEAIKDFLRKTKHSFHLINFPPYAPELNPQEHVWKAGRANVTHNTFIENIDSATDQFLNYLNETVFEYKFL